jgi:hypothetical protein
VPDPRDVWGQVDSHESDRGLSYPFNRQGYLEIGVRENFGAARFSTFSIVSAVRRKAGIELYSKADHFDFSEDDR